MMDDIIARWRLLKGTIRWLELALAAASLALVNGSALALLTTPGWGAHRFGQGWMGWIARGFRIEALVLGILILLALLVEFRRGTPWLRMMWGCLGALAGLAVLGVSSSNATTLPGLLLAYVAGSLAALRTQAGLGRLVVWSLVGLGSHAALMLLILIVVGVFVAAASR